MNVKSFWVKNGLNIRDILYRRTLPKHIYLRKNRYEVLLTKDKRLVYGGRYMELEDAIEQRNRLIA